MTVPALPLERDGTRPIAARGARVELRGVTRRFGAFTAVDAIDMEVAAGEFLTLLGPSGSGKTTILNIVAGFLSPDAGHVLVDGEPVDRLPAHKRDFGVVFQNYALFPHMSVFDNVAFPLRMRGISRKVASSRVMKVLEMLRLPEQAQKMPSQLSGGQQQRVAVARAVVFEPRVVLMDEPLSALDRRLREAVQIELKELHRTIGATVIYVTHDQGEALTMSDRIAVLRAGRVIQIAPPATIYDQPADAFVASFVGEANRMIGRVVAIDGDTVRIETDEGLSLSAAVKRGAFSVGDPVSVAIRPERVRLSAIDAPGGQTLGHVERLLFVGDTSRYWVALAGGGVIQASVQNSDSARTWREGDEVHVSWNPGSVRVLAQDQSG